MTHPEQVVTLANAAGQFEGRAADAAALLIDAVAMLAVEGDVSLHELLDRLLSSIDAFTEADASLTNLN